MCTQGHHSFPCSSTSNMSSPAPDAPCCQICRVNPPLDSKQGMWWGKDPCNPLAVLFRCLQCRYPTPCAPCADRIMKDTALLYGPVIGYKLFPYRCPGCRLLQYCNVPPHGQPCTRAMLARWNDLMTALKDAYHAAQLHQEHDLLRAHFLFLKLYPLPDRTPLGDEFNAGFLTLAPLEVPDAPW